jgi:CRP/FNR family transcriptional regulator
MDIFNGIPPKGREFLYHIGRMVTLPPGGHLFSEGDPALGFFIILKGRMLVYRPSHSGKKQPVAERGPGEVIGEMGILSEIKIRTASVQAIEETLLLEIPEDPLAQLLAIQDTASALQLLGNLVCVVAGKLRERVAARRVAPDSQLLRMKELESDFQSGLETIEKHLPQKGLFLKSARVQTLDDGEVLYRQGDAAQDFCFVFTGALRVIVTDPDGTRREIDCRRGPTIVGETGFFSGEKRMADVIADGPVRLSRFPGGEFEKLKTRNPQEAMKALYSVAQIITQMNYNYGKHDHPPHE